MATFKAPTAFTETAGDHPLWRHFGPREAGRNVYYMVDGTITENDPASWDDVQTVWWGGHAATEVTAAEATALTAAGYTVVD